MLSGWVDGSSYKTISQPLSMLNGWVDGSSYEMATGILQ